MECLRAHPPLKCPVAAIGAWHDSMEDNLWILVMLLKLVPVQKVTAAVFWLSRWIVTQAAPFAALGPAPSSFSHRLGTAQPFSSPPPYLSDSPGACLTCTQRHLHFIQWVITPSFPPRASPKEAWASALVQQRWKVLPKKWKDILFFVHGRKQKKILPLMFCVTAKPQVNTVIKMVCLYFIYIHWPVPKLLLARLPAHRHNYL